jgi:hypothetical protein
MDQTKATSRPSNARSRARRTTGDDAALGLTTEPTGASPAEGSLTPRGIVAQVRERATSQLSTQKDRATDGLGSIAQAVRQTTGKLREEQQDTMAQYVEKAADQIERLSNSLRDKDVNELLQDAQRFARQQPALFIGGSFAVGLLAARFLKSSSDARTANEYRAPATSDYTSPADFDEPGGGRY